MLFVFVRCLLITASKIFMISVSDPDPVTLNLNVKAEGAESETSRHRSYVNDHPRFLKPTVLQMHSAYAPR